MVDFTYYCQEYLGVQIPEKHFDRCLARASDVLQAMERVYRIAGTAEERKLALCAMAEGVYEQEHRRGVVSATAGSMSVRYADAHPRQLWRELYDKAAIYLEISRGVGV